jgi:hypothetical protein
MTVMTALRTARTIGTLATVSVVATLVVGAGTAGTSAGSGTGSHHPDVASATKEWKGARTSTTTTMVLATKEWKISTATVSPGTKEW